MYDDYYLKLSPYSCLPMFLKYVSWIEATRPWKRTKERKILRLLTCSQRVSAYLSFFLSLTVPEIITLVFMSVMFVDLFYLALETHWQRTKETKAIVGIGLSTRLWASNAHSLIKLFLHTEIFASSSVPRK